MNGDEGTAALTGPASMGPGSTWRVIMLVVMALLGAAVLVALIVTLGEANSQRDRALKAQSQSYDVMILARTLSGTIARSEAALGRYVISVDKQLGRLYAEDWRLAGEQLSRLDRLTGDNPGQRPRIERLRAAYRTRGAELSVTALSTSYGKNSQALARYYQAGKAEALVEINRTLDELIAAERRLLMRRTTAAMASVESSARAARVLMVFGILIVLGAIALGWLTVSALGERAAAQADAEAERERAEELAHAVAVATAELQVQEAKLRQVQKMEAVGQLTGGIAHDFNNMLAVVLGGLELARRQVDSDPVAAARHIDSAAEGAARAAALTRRLLTFSREEALRPEPIAAGALVDAMSELLDRTLGDGVTVSARDDARGWLLRADRVQLENVLLNLAVNARDAMDARGTLTIETGAATLADQEVGHSAAGEYVTVAVTDTGCGMVPAVVERVFEPFFTTKPAGKGTGLGLSQIFAFVRQHEGEIAIASAPGQGTTVTLYLPRDRSAAIAPAAVELFPAPGLADIDTALQVLVVEDDPRVLAATVGAIEELGHRAVACDDPLAAPALIDRHDSIDLVISDVLMPRQSGPEMIAGIRARAPHLAVLFVTGFAGDATAEDLGGHQVLRKPYTLAGLERAIAAARAADRPAPPERIAAE